MGAGPGSVDGTGSGLVTRLRRRDRITPTATATARIALMAIAAGERSRSASEAGNLSTEKRTCDSEDTSRRFIHVAELVVVLLGAGAPEGTMTRTEYVAFEPPARVRFTPGEGSVPLWSGRDRVL